MWLLRDFPTMQSSYSKSVLFVENARKVVSETHFQLTLGYLE
jgi:hypothetical protein